MKQSICILAIWLFALSLSAVQFQINADYDFAGKYKAESDEIGDFDNDSRFGFSGSFEVLIPMLEDIAFIGPGIEYQLLRKLDGNLDSKYGFIPVYGSLRWGLFEGDVLRPEIIVQTGYNFHTGNDAYRFGDTMDLAGCMYYAFGFGVVHGGNTSLELLYRVHKGRMSGTGIWECGDVDVDITQRNLTFRLGWRF